MQRDSAARTFRGWSGNARETKDVILSSAVVSDVSGLTWEGVPSGSDHLPTAAFFVLPPCGVGSKAGACKSKKTSFRSKGWKPGPRFDASAVELTSVACSLGGLQASLQTLAADGVCEKRARPREIGWKAEGEGLTAAELRQAWRDRLAKGDPEAPTWHRAWRRRRRQDRRAQATAELHEAVERGGLPKAKNRNSLPLGVGVLGTSAEACEAVRGHFSIFLAGRAGDDKPAWLDELPPRDPEWTLDYERVDAARSRLKERKATGDDGVCAEVILNLPANAVENVRLLFFSGRWRRGRTSATRAHGLQLPWAYFRNDLGRRY